MTRPHSPLPPTPRRIRRTKRTFGAALLPLACTAVLSLGAGLLVAPGVALADTGDNNRNHGPADTSRPTPPPPPAKTPRTDSRSVQIDAIRAAQAKAKSTGKPVVVDALTTGTSQITANPNGTVSTDSTPVVERVKGTDGSWRAVDATLRANADGTLAPAAVPSALTFSGGGSGPLATMVTADGKKLSLKAPFTLPKPELNGDSALYRSVLPDVDLELRATPAGGWRQVLIVRTAQAAADPKIKQLHLETVTDGLTVKAGAAGNLTAEDTGGNARFTAPAPIMWDSSAEAPKVQGKGAAAPAAGDTTAPAPASSSKGPGAGARTAVIAATVGGGGIDLVPDASVLGQGTGPWYLDPNWNPQVDNGAQAWAQVQSAYPDNPEYNGTKDGQDRPAAGYCGFSDCTRKGQERAYFQIGLNPLFWDSAVQDAKLYANVVMSSSPGSPTPMRLFTTGPIGPSTTWKNQPCGHSFCSEVTTVSIMGTGGVEFPVKGQMEQAAREHWGTWTILFAPSDENNMYYRQRFDNHPHVVVTYDFAPSVGTPATSPTPGFAGSAAYSPCQTPGAASPWSNPGWVGRNTDINLSTDTASPTGEQLLTTFQIWDDDDHGSSKYYNTGWQGSSGRVSLSVGPLIDGHRYGWQASTTDGTLNSGNTSWCFLRVDRTPPTARVSSTDFPESGTIGGHPKLVGQEGTFTLSGSDPAPPGGGRSSGLACARWTTDPVQAGSTGWGCNDGGNVVKMDGDGSFQLKYTPWRWGTNFLYLQTQDNAGNMSQPVTYTYFVPNNPAVGDPVMGDIDGDRKADVLLPDGSGALRLVGASVDPYAAPNAKPASAPGTTDWSNVQITHRGSFNDRNVDDLVAHAPGSPDLFLYANDDVAAHLDGQAAVALDKSRRCKLPDGTAISCTDYGSSDTWSSVTQLAAFGSPKGDTPANAGTVTAGLPRSSLLYVENGRLWMALSSSVGKLDGQAVLLSQNQAWDSYDLITPGAAKGTNVPTLWSRSKADGSIHAYQLAKGAMAGTVDASDLADPAKNQFATGIDPKVYPKVGSNGDLTGDGVPDLWAVDTSNQLVAWAAVGTKAADATTGPTVTGLEAAPTVLGNLNRPIANWLAAPDGTNTVVDGQGRANGTAAGVTWAADTVAGRSTTVAGFSRAANATITTQGPVIDTRKSFTVSTWVKPGSAGGIVASQSAVHNSNVILYSEGDGRPWRFAVSYADGAGWTYHYTDAPGPAAIVQAGVWTQLTGSYNSDTGLMSLYVNGTLAGTQSHQSSLSSAPSGSFVLGRYKQGDQLTDSFDGSISGTAVYPFAVTPTAPGASSPVRYGADANLCLDDDYGRTTDGNTIQVTGCNGLGSQSVSLPGDGTLRVMGGCIAPVNSGTANGTQLEYRACNGTAAQRWIPSATGNVINPASGRCLDLPNGQTAYGTRPQLWDCNLTTAQLWNVASLRTAVLPGAPRS